MKTLNGIVFGLICLQLLTACQKQKLEKADYIRYVADEDNGLKVIKEIGNIKYSLQYKPVEYILLNENKTAKKEDLEGMQYYTLQYSVRDHSKDILKEGISSAEEYYERLNYLSFGLQDDIYLVDGRDTLECILFNHVRSYGLSPNADFILGFEQNKNRSLADKQLVIDDKVFGASVIKLKIFKNDLANIPELKNN